MLGKLRFEEQNPIDGKEKEQDPLFFWIQSDRGEGHQTWNLRGKLIPIPLHY